MSLQISLDDCAPGVDEGHTVAFQPLQYKTFAPKDSCTQLFGKGNLDFNTLGSAQESVFLT